MKLITSPDKIGSKQETSRIISNICFTDIMAVELWKTEPIQYIYGLQMIALDNKLDIYYTEDYEKSMVLLINAIYRN
jgi:hypothetical protein